MKTDKNGQNGFISKADSALAAIYEEPLVSTPVKHEEVPVEEKKQDPLPTQSNEGKLKLFIGGLYFQTEQDLRDYFKKIAPILQLTLITDRSNSGSKGYAFITLEDKDGSVRKKVLSTSHYIRGKIVDLKLEDSNKKVTDQLSANKKIFVGGLDSSIDASELRKYFEKYGGVHDAIVIRNVNTNASRGFGFVTFDSEEVADKCVRDNNYKIKGKRIDIKKADPRQTRPRQPRVYPLNSFEDTATVRDYYPPWPHFPPGGFGYPGAENFKEGAVPPMVPWMYPPAGIGFPQPEEFLRKPGSDGGSSGSDEKSGSREEKSADKKIGPIKDYVKKSRTYCPY